MPWQRKPILAAIPTKVPFLVLVAHSSPVKHRRPARWWGSGWKTRELEFPHSIFFPFSSYSFFSPRFTDFPFPLPSVSPASLSSSFSYLFFFILSVASGLRVSREIRLNFSPSLAPSEVTTCLATTDNRYPTEFVYPVLYEDPGIGFLKMFVGKKRRRRYAFRFTRIIFPPWHPVPRTESTNPRFYRRS